MNVIVLSSVAGAVCLGIGAQLIYEDIEARREMRRAAYKPRHAVEDTATVRVPIAAVAAAVQEAGVHQ